MIDPKKFSHYLIAAFSMLAFTAMVFVMCKWFGETNPEETVPGWGWGRFFTGIFLGGGGASIIMMACYGLFSCSWFCDQDAYKVEREAAESILEAFSGFALLGFPALLWWGLYLA